MYCSSIVSHLSKILDSDWSGAAFGGQQWLYDEIWLCFPIEVLSKLYVRVIYIALTILCSSHLLTHYNWLIIYNTSMLLDLFSVNAFSMKPVGKDAKTQKYLAIKKSQPGHVQEKGDL